MQRYAIIEITASCDDHVMQSEEHISQLNEEKDQLASNIRQEVAHSNAMETEHVSDMLSTMLSLFLW